jgi:hypothetical protein
MEQLYSTTVLTWTLCVVFLPLIPGISLSSVDALTSINNSRYIQKSTLISWDSHVILGHCIEERDSGVRGAGSTLTIRLESSTSPDNDNDDDDNDDDTLIVRLPGNDEAGSGSLASEVWPAAIASSILLRSNEFRSYATSKSIVELGSGCGLTGIVAAETSSTCLLTDNDERAVNILRTATCPQNQDNVRGRLSTLQLDWRDGLSDGTEGHSTTDLVLGSDVAYYYFLLRPMMDTVRAFMGAGRGGTLMVVGQANRDSQWDLYKNIKNGCYNQLTDAHEPPWPGMTTLLLYKLRMSSVCNCVEECEKQIETTLPMSVILHQDILNDSEESNSLPFYPFQDLAHVATELDDESIMKSF